MRTRSILSPMLSLAIAMLLLVLVMPSDLAAQANVATGSIQGTITDPSVAAVSGAKVNITSSSTGSSQELTTNSSGFYNSGTLQPDRRDTMIGYEWPPCLCPLPARLPGSSFL